MITTRRLLLFSFLPLLAGCATPTCPPAGTASYACETCWYQLMVTKLYADTDEVEGMYPKLESKGADMTKTFRFRVENVAMKQKTGQLQEKHTYVFHNVDHSVYLQVMPEGYEEKYRY